MKINIDYLENILEFLDILFICEIKCFNFEEDNELLFFISYEWGDKNVDKFTILFNDILQEEMDYFKKNNLKIRFIFKNNYQYNVFFFKTNDLYYSKFICSSIFSTSLRNTDFKMRESVRMVDILFNSFPLTERKDLICLLAGYSQKNYNEVNQFLESNITFLKKYPIKRFLNILKYY